MTPTHQPEIDPTTAAQRVRDGGALLLDPAALSSGRAVIAVCRSGARSSRAVATLTAAGVRATSLTGGRQAWQAAGLPVVSDGESPGRVM
ncbi:rhodanese-like domain-containing protein [Dermatophilaceae bacterium Soc4.6]